MTRAPELLLLLLAAASTALSQAPPSIAQYVGDTLVRVNVSEDRQKTVECPAGDPFLGISNKDNTQRLTSERRLVVDLSYTAGSIADLQRMRNEKLGAYHCLYMQSGGPAATAFVLSEQPNPRLINRDRIKELHTEAGLGNVFDERCPATASGTVVWERYNDRNGLFERHSTGQRMRITYTEAQREQSSGFTIYRCYDESSPENIVHFRIIKSKDLTTRQFRTSNYESTVLPHYVKPSNKISLECKGAGRATGERPRYEFKKQGNDAYQQLYGNETEYTFQYDQAQSQIQIFPMRPVHRGKYFCIKGGVLQRASIDIDYGQVSIKSYTKRNYSMHSSNYIECIVSEKDFRELAYFLLYRPGMPTLKIDAKQTVEGYSSSVTSDGIALSFPGKDEALNARLECNLPFTMDYTTIVKQKPKLTLQMKSDPSYLEFECKKDKSFNGDMKVVQLLPNGTFGQPIVSTGSTRGDSAKYYLVPPPSTFKQFVCYADHEGETLRSNIQQFGTPPVTVDIIVAGDKNPAKKIFLAGRDVDIVCSFNGVPASLSLEPSAVSLQKAGVELPSSVPADRLNSTHFRYTLPRVATSDSGMYTCVYNKTGASLLRAAPPLQGTYSSRQSELVICSSSQFVCDGTCKDNSLQCDKKQDCADGSDEREEYCSKCEPNEILCQTHAGVSARKRCILKHWLCDGQDDCGNGYDEDKTIHRKWCFKEAPCTGCQLHETCCPGVPNSKCVPRAYECDKERDCPGPVSEESACLEADCLRLTEPSARRTIDKRVGESLDLTCVASGTERPTINWRRNWAALPASGVTESNAVTGREFSGVYTVEGKLQFASITKEMAGIYNCEAVNNCKRIMSYEIELRVSD